MTDNNENRPGWYGRLAKAVAWILGILIAAVLALEVLLSTSMMTDTVNKIAGRYIDGDISFGKGIQSGKPLEQGGGDHIDPLVGTLGGQTDRDQQLIVMLVFQRAHRIRIGFF